MAAFHFKPSARLQRYLGQELIADPNLAILEFVKNAYDAGASNVFISFSIPAGGASSLVIADDGEGMDEKSFEKNWMHPGFSAKSPDAPAAVTRGVKPSLRPQVGEKGLGRLAAGRLGKTLDVYTRRTERHPWLHVTFDWSDFNDMTKQIDEIDIEYELGTSPDDQPVTAGTILVIGGLEQNWATRVRGRPVPGRSRTRLGRLKQDLQLLVRPLGPTDPSFTIHLDSDSVLDPDDIGEVTPAAAVDEADYVYDFSFRRRGPDVVIRRELRRSRKLVDEFGGARKQGFSDQKLSVVARAERRPDTLDCGDFTGRFLYSPPVAARRAKEIDAVGSGVLLYRDNVLVEPYGLDGNDWVGVTARKAQRQGYALIQPSLFSGYVLISRDENPDLRDMSNRQGLLDSDVSESFVRHVQAEFSVFESEVFDELKQRWESKESKAARQAEESIDLAAIRLRAIAHSLGQPLVGLDADITSIRLVAGRREMPADLGSSLVQLADSAEAHLKQARSSLARFRDVPVAERTMVGVKDLVTASVRQIDAFAQSRGVMVHLGVMPARDVMVHKELMVEAIAELIRNAVEAPRFGAAGEVHLSASEDTGDFVLVISDDGAGLVMPMNGDIGSIASTQGRPGMGLATVMEIVAASRGRLSMKSTGSSGTTFELALPDRISGLRER